MTDFVIAPTTSTTQLRANVRDMLDAGELIAFRVRGNGTERPMSLLPIGSTDRETAEWIYGEYDDGRSIRGIAREIHSSEATVWRFLLALELTEEIEAGDWDDIWAGIYESATTGGHDVIVIDASALACLEDMGDDVAVFRPSPAEKAAAASAGVLFS
jgi:hypothetical protein